MRQAVLDDNTLREVAMAVARNNVGAQRPAHEVAASEGLTIQQLLDIQRNPLFLKYVDAYTVELQESGFSFAAKSRILAEDLLPTAYHMAKDPDIPASVRIKAIENLVEWGDLKPKSNNPQQTGPGFSITINIPDPNTGKTQAITLEHINPALEPAQTSSTPALVFAEGDDYEYAGDDVYE
jgi:hypothetical protein